MRRNQNALQLVLNAEPGAELGVSPRGLGVRIVLEVAGLEGEVVHTAHNPVEL